jgi:hypothetical protein
MTAGIINGLSVPDFVKRFTANRSVRETRAGGTVGSGSEASDRLD